MELHIWTYIKNMETHAYKKPYMNIFGHIWTLDQPIFTLLSNFDLAPRFSETTSKNMNFGIYNIIIGEGLLLAQTRFVIFNEKSIFSKILII